MPTTVRSEIAGSVWKVEVGAGQAVAEGDVLIILESMKMEIPVTSTTAGKIKAILVKLDDVIAEGQVVAIIDAGGGTPILLMRDNLSGGGSAAIAALKLCGRCHRHPAMT